MKTNEDLLTPNMPLSEIQQKAFEYYLADYDITNYYFSSVNRANLFHDILSLAEDLRIAVHHGAGDMKVFEVLATSKEEAQSLDDTMAERTRLIKLHDNKEAERFKSRDEAEFYHEIMMQGVSNYRNWPEIKPINDQFQE